VAAVMNENSAKETEPVTQQVTKMQHVTQAIPISINEEPLFEDELARQAAMKHRS
jgi:hypothetical protein